MRRFPYSKIVLCAFLVSTGTFAWGAEVFRLDFENGSNLTEESVAGLTGTIEQVGTGGSLTQSSDVPAGVSGTGSASFSPGGAQDGLFIQFDDANFPDFGTEDDFTLSFWLKPSQDFVEGGPGFRGVISGVSELEPNLDWQIDNGDTVGGGTGDGTTTLSRLSGKNNYDLSDTNLAVDVWQELTIVYEAASNQLLTILDGEVTGVHTYDNGFAMESLLVGTNRNGTRVYDGLLDNIVILDTASLPNGSGGLQEYGDIDSTPGIGVGDWERFRSGQGADLSSLSDLDAYRLGDLNFDGVNDLADFIAFRGLYNEANGAGALEALLVSVPEPTALSLVGLLGAVFWGCSRRTRSQRMKDSSEDTQPRKGFQIMHNVNRYGVLAVVALAMSMATANAQVTAFSADFEGGTTTANVGTLGISAVGVHTIESVSGTHTDTDWGNSALFADRVNGATNSDFDPGYTLTWNFVNPVALDGATINLENIAARINTPDAKSFFVNAYDSAGRTAFSLYIIDREDGGLFNAVPDYGAADERQRQTVGYIHPVEGKALFAAADIATGAIPDTNGSNTLSDFFIGRVRPGETLDQSQAAIFQITTSSTGWSLDAKSFDGSALGDFTTNELAFFNPAAVDIGRIEIVGQTVQAGAFWDNFSVTGTNFVTDQPDIPEATPLTLQVTSNGELKLLGGSNGPDAAVLFPGTGDEVHDIEIEALEILSASGSLIHAGYTGLAGAPGFPAADGDGLNGWALNDPLSTAIFESNLTGSSIISIDDNISLGTAFDTNGTQDLTFRYVHNGAVVEGIVEYVEASGLPGDFNGDNIVDAADYTVWRDNLNGDESALNGNGDGIGGVDMADFNLWKQHFGETAGAALVASAAVPEPGAIALACLGLVSVGYFLRRS